MPLIYLQDESYYVAPGKLWNRTVGQAQFRVHREPSAVARRTLVLCLDSNFRLNLKIKN
jgi:hypothetical protein